MSFLIRHTRNALMKNDILFSPRKFARWEDLQRLWYLKKQCQLRLAPKLTAAHLELPLGTKMKVKIATQTLSHSSTAAIRVYVWLGDMSERALDTAEFVERVNLMSKCSTAQSSYNDQEFDEQDIIHEAIS